MEDSSLKQTTFKATVWSASEMMVRYAFQLIITIVLARYVLPSQYGIFAIVGVFITLFQAIIDGGLGAALIRKRNPSQMECSAMFYYNTAIGIGSYILLFFAAPFIASFFNIPPLTIATRILGIALIFIGLTCIHQTLLTIRLDYKTMTKISLLSSIFSGGIGALMAINDFQVWAVVSQMLLFHISNCILFWIFSDWRPSFFFSFKCFKSLWSFASRIMISSVIDILYQTIYTLSIGKFFDSRILGFYNRATAFTNFSAIAPTFVLQRISFPTLCKVQNDNERLTSQFRSFLQITAFTTMPICMIIAGIANPLIAVLMTDKWLFAANLLIILLFASMWHPVQAISLNILQVNGNAKSFLRAEVIKKIFGLITLVVCLFHSIEMVCFGMISVGLFSYLIGLYYTRKSLSIPFSTQIRDIAPSVILSILAFLSSYYLSNQLGNNIWSLLISLATGIGTYLLFATIFLNDYIKELFKIINSLKNNHFSS